MLIISSVTDHTVTPGPGLDFAKLIHAPSFGLANTCGHHAAECDGARR
jgi:hypothetical protein